MKVRLFHHCVLYTNVLGFQIYVYQNKKLDKVYYS